MRSQIADYEIAIEYATRRGATNRFALDYADYYTTQHPADTPHPAAYLLFTAARSPVVSISAQTHAETQRRDPQ